MVITNLEWNIMYGLGLLGYAIMSVVVFLMDAFTVLVTPP